MKYRELKESELSVAAKLNAGAFADYPLCEDVKDGFKFEERFLRIMSEIFKVYILAYRKLGCPIFVGEENGEIVSFVILVLPGMKKVTLLDYIKAGADKLFFMTSPVRLLKLMSILDEGHEPCDNIIKKSWMIECLAVEKNNKGKGFGSEMIQDCVIPYVKGNMKEKSIDLILFTNNEINRKFYKKNGFTEFDSEEIKLKNRTIGNWSYIMHIEA